MPSLSPASLPPHPPFCRVLPADTRLASSLIFAQVLSLQSETAEQVEREIALMRACACPHIVAYKDAFRAMLDGRRTLHVVMELAELGSTLDVIKRRGMALPEGATACHVER